MDTQNTDYSYNPYFTACQPILFLIFLLHEEDPRTDFQPTPSGGSGQNLSKRELLQTVQAVPISITEAACQGSGAGHEVPERGLRHVTIIAFFIPALAGFR